MCPGYHSSAGPQLGSVRWRVSSGSRGGGARPASTNRTRNRPVGWARARAGWPRGPERHARRTSRPAPAYAGSRPPSRSWCGRSRSACRSIAVVLDRRLGRSSSASSQRSPSNTRDARSSPASRRSGDVAGPCSYSPSRRRARRRSRGAGSRRPTRPLPMNGDGERAGIVGGEEEGGVSRRTRWRRLRVETNGGESVTAPDCERGQHSRRRHPASPPPQLRAAVWPLRPLRGRTTPIPGTAEAKWAGRGRPVPRGHQPGIAFLEALALECVQQVEIDGRAAAERIPGPEVEVIVGRERDAGLHIHWAAIHPVPVGLQLEAARMRIQRRGVGDRCRYAADPACRCQRQRRCPAWP